MGYQRRKFIPVPARILTAPQQILINRLGFVKQVENENKFISRNSPCPCNSGKKFKNCCLNKA